MIQLFNCSAQELIESKDVKMFQKVSDVVIVTDPPFNIGYRYKTYKDRMKADDYYNMLQSVFGNFKFVIIHYPEAIYELAVRMQEAPKKVCSWVYNSNTAKQHRDIAYFRVEPIMKQMTQPYKNPNDKRIKELIKNGKSGGRLYDWYEVNQVKNVSKQGNFHPCVMPVKVMENVIGVLPKGSLIIDPFCGSGTTAVACKNLGYDFIGCDIDADYLQIAKNRIENNY